MPVKMGTALVFSPWAVLVTALPQLSSSNNLVIRKKEFRYFHPKVRVHFQRAQIATSMSEWRQMCLLSRKVIHSGGEPGGLTATLIFKRTLISGDEGKGWSNRYEDTKHGRNKEVIATVIGRPLICSLSWVNRSPSVHHVSSLLGASDVSPMLTGC